MKIRVSDPKVAAATVGGCTFEPEVGWWTFSTEPAHQALGSQFDGERDALYIPTLQKTGEPVVEADIIRFKELAKSLGFTEVSAASGMWILSETGEAQVEHIWICWALKVAVHVRSGMRNLAEEIKKATNQDCVAWEAGGQLHFTASE